MKVLVPGNPKKERPDLQFCCNRCGCVFIAEYGEYKIFDSQIDGRSYDAKCPCCGNSIATYNPRQYT